MGVRTGSGRRTVGPVVPTAGRSFTRSLVRLALGTCKASWTEASGSSRDFGSRAADNAIRRCLLDAGVIEAVTAATRSGQVVLYQLTDIGRRVCEMEGINPGRVPRERLEHRF